MKFFHISDLHIGKRVCGFSMLEDQREVLTQFLTLVKEQNPDGIWIAGDLYDKSMPSAEAVELADWFLSSLAARKIPVWVISGNHDCAERIAYGSRMMEASGIYMSRVFDGTVQRYTVTKNGDGTVQISAAEKYAGTDAEEQTEINNVDVEEERMDIFLLPYIKPAQVRRFFPEQTIETTQDALMAILGKLDLRKDRANILLMHQFMAGASVCESEELSVGGSDQISADVVDGFDYVALGHLHGPQKVSRESIRYCGSLLKYSFSETAHKKSVTVVYIEKEPVQSSDQKFVQKPAIKIETIPLKPLRDMREIRGPIEQLLSPEVYKGTNTEDYLHITLTDEHPVIDAIGRLRDVYPNIMRLDFAAQKEQQMVEEEPELEEKTPQELFEEFYIRQNGQKISEAQSEVLQEIWEICLGHSNKRVSLDDAEKQKGGERI